mmetsp:Transcript_144552/g.251997  ORF Transcript_144552/g.251997 Transcript_144552/m.251997 type:complete len:80 (+) Transcript_144552:576-815(+)
MNCQTHELTITHLHPTSLMPNAALHPTMRLLPQPSCLHTTNPPTPILPCTINCVDLQIDCMKKLEFICDNYDREYPAQC